MWNRYSSRVRSPDKSIGSRRYVSREGTGFIHRIVGTGRRFYRRPFRFSGLSNRFRLSKLHRNRCRCPRFCRGIINQHLLISTRARGGPTHCRWTTCKKTRRPECLRLKYNRSMNLSVYKCAHLTTREGKRNRIILIIFRERNANCARGIDEQHVRERKNITVVPFSII